MPEPKEKRIINSQDVADVAVILAAYHKDEVLNNWVINAMTEKIQREQMTRDAFNDLIKSRPIKQQISTTRERSIKQ